MIIFPACKINIGLQVIARREDGFHEIATVFYPLPLSDVLEVVTSEEKNTTFHLSGDPVPGSQDDNLCLKAYRMLKNDFAALPQVHIYLHKGIPIGAGLGGGSSDAAAMLKLLNAKYGLGLSPDRLANYAARLGSDCAFFLQDRPCYATGRGEELYPFTQEDLGDYHFILVCPEVHISTAWAYGKVVAKHPVRSLLDLVREPVVNWKGKVINDFEKPVFDAYPELAKIRDALYRQGALYASLSGSGAALFGIFPKEGWRVDEEAFGTAKVFHF